MNKFLYLTHITNKKVLLRERKRHTARRVVSTPSVVLTGYRPDLAGGYPTGVPPPTGYPPAGYPLAGYPPSRVPPGWTWQGTPPGVCPMAFCEMLQSIMGYGYPFRCLPHGILGNVAKHYGIWVPPWTDRWKDRHVSKHYLPVVLRTRAVMNRVSN